MLVPQPKKRAFDRAIILPALVFIVQSIPWFAARFRMRVLAPFMLVYILISLVRWHPRGSSRARISAALWALLTFVLYSASYVFLWWQYHGEFANHIFVTRVFAFFGLWVFTTLMAEHKVKEIKVLTLITLGSLFLASLMGATYLEDEINRDIIRTMTADGASLRDAADAALSGVGSYGSVYAIGLLAPSMFYATMQVKGLLLKWFCGISVVAFFVYAYRAGFSILMFASIAGCLFYGGTVVFRSYKLHKWVMWLFVSLVLYATLSPSIANITVYALKQLATLTTNPNYVYRLEATIDAITGGSDTYALDRAGLMWVSFQTFLRHPIIGGGKWY